MIKNRVAKLMAIAIIGINIAISLPQAASASWKQNSTGWWYTEGNNWSAGWRLIDNNWYYFYSDGYMASNTTIDGYYLNSSGAWSNISEVAQQISYSEFCNNVNSEMLRLVNEHRKANGVNLLVEANELMISAKAKSQHMEDNNYFSHYYNDLDSRQIFNEEINGENIQYKHYKNDFTKSNAENLAKELFDSWKNSSSHNANMLDNMFTEYGFGIAKGTYNGEEVIFATQLFRIKTNANISNDKSSKLKIVTSEDDAQQYILIKK